MSQPQPQQQQQQQSVPPSSQNPTVQKIKDNLPRILRGLHIATIAAIVLHFASGSNGSFAFFRIAFFVNVTALAASYWHVSTDSTNPARSSQPMFSPKILLSQDIQYILLWLTFFNNIKGTSSKIFLSNILIFGFCFVFPQFTLNNPQLFQKIAGLCSLNEVILFFLSIFSLVLPSRSIIFTFVVLLFCMLRSFTNPVFNSHFKQYDANITSILNLKFPQYSGGYSNFKEQFLAVRARIGKALLQ